MSSAATLPTFMDLSSTGHAKPDETDDFVDRWHEVAAARESPVSLPAFLGMTREEYEYDVHDAGALPAILRGRRDAKAPSNSVQISRRRAGVRSTHTRLHRSSEAGSSGLRWWAETLSGKPILTGQIERTATRTTCVLSTRDTKSA